MTQLLNLLIIKNLFKYSKNTLKDVENLLGKIKLKKLINMFKKKYFFI